MARAYLLRLRQAGLTPACILLMVLDKHPGTKKTYPQWIPGWRWYAEKMQGLSLNHWARHIHMHMRPLFDAVQHGLEPLYGDVPATLQAMLGALDWRDFSPQVKRVTLSGIKDPRLKTALEALEYKTVLFTGGGIVPKDIFTIPGLRILHVHPGHLPHVRGADGVLWSIAERGCPGVSLFYMEAGLDTGDLIRASDQPLPRFNLAGMPPPDTQMLYRALFGYYDPLLRADFLTRVFLDYKNHDPTRLPCTPQDTSQGKTYRFMNENQRAEALKKLFVL